MRTEGLLVAPKAPGRAGPRGLGCRHWARLEGWSRRPQSRPFAALRQRREGAFFQSPVPGFSAPGCCEAAACLLPGHTRCFRGVALGLPSSLTTSCCNPQRPFPGTSAAPGPTETPGRHPYSRTRVPLPGPRRFQAAARDSASVSWGARNK